MKILVDTNVLLDVLAERKPFHHGAAGVWFLAESGQIEAVVSAISFTTIFYLGRRQFGHERAMQAVIKVRDVFGVAAVDEQIVSRAIWSGIVDFEDAIQVFSAIGAPATHIVTRDSSGFSASPIPVVTAEQLLALVSKSPR